jgi:hypothetical protein
MLLRFTADVHLEISRAGIGRHSWLWDFRVLFSWGKSFCAFLQDEKSSGEINSLPLRAQIREN